MTATDRQVRTFMTHYARTGKLKQAADAANISPDTARKYRDLGLLPSQIDRPIKASKSSNLFEAHWPAVKVMLEEAPELEAKTLFNHLHEKYPDTYHEGQLRSFQRRVSQWRALEGPPKQVFFQQQHRPGEAIQVDFTWMTELKITIAGEAFDHMLCHVVLPYSNWQHATLCRSESLLALRKGIQAALFRLGHVPEFCQTDNSTSATHRIDSKKRDFNEDYRALMRHYHMTPRTIAIGKKEQNGDVESLHNVLKKRVKQHLLMRGSRDFESARAYQSWLNQLFDKANRLRQKKITEELKAMRPLTVKPLADYREEKVKVSRYSLIRVMENIYSVPSRLIGHPLRVKVYEDHLEVYFKTSQQLIVERLLGRKKHQINYRHIIDSLLRKPGAFARYRYREDLFPTLTFRQSYDSLCEEFNERKADLAYLRILKLAASTMESEVETALELLLEVNQTPSIDHVKDLMGQNQSAKPSVKIDPVNLNDYDALLESLTSQTDNREAA
jgi:transposase InsO family protein